MSESIDLNLLQKRIITNLIEVNKWSCRTLFYNNQVYFFFTDLIRCFDFPNSFAVTLLNVLDKNEIVLLKNLPVRSDQDINQSTIDLLEELEKECPFVHHNALQKIINHSTPTHESTFSSFIQNTLLPTIESIVCYPEPQKRINTIDKKQALSGPSNTFWVFKTGPGIYEIRKQNAVPLRLTNEDDLLIKNESPKVDFYSLLKEEGYRMTRELKRCVINWLRATHPGFRQTFDINAAIISQEFKKVRPFQISHNHLFLNNSTIQDVIETYNRFKRESEAT